MPQRTIILVIREASNPWGPHQGQVRPGDPGTLVQDEGCPIRDNFQKQPETAQHFERLRW